MVQDTTQEPSLRGAEPRPPLTQGSSDQRFPGEVTAGAKTMLVLTDDAVQQEELTLCASKLGLGVRFLSTGIELLQVLTDRHSGESVVFGEAARSHEASDHFALLVLAGQVPTWVHLDLVTRLKSGLARGKHYRSGILIPVMFLSQDGNLKLVMEQISRGLLADFMQLPIRPTELQVRMQALMERWDMVASVTEGNHSDPVNDVSDSVFGELSELSTPADSGVRTVNYAPVDRSHGDRSWGEYLLSPSQNTATIGGKQVRLTNREFVVAWTLFNSLGDVVTRDELRLAMAKRHRSNKEIMNRSLDAYICRLRVLLNLTSDGSMSLMPVYGVGYVLRPNQL
jgi:DNA-binding response OmpR family regulator